MWPQLTHNEPACHSAEEEAQERGWARTWRVLGSHGLLYTEDCHLPFQPNLLFPGSPLQHLLSQDSLPPAHLMLLGASSCLTTFCASIFSSSCHSPPISSSRESPLIHSLPLAAIHGCCSRCLKAEQRTCLCPHTAEGSILSPAVAPCCLPHSPWVQVLTSASLMPLLPPQ